MEQHSPLPSQGCASLPKSNLDHVLYGGWAKMEPRKGAPGGPSRGGSGGHPIIDFLLFLRNGFNFYFFDF